MVHLIQVGRLWGGNMKYGFSNFEEIADPAAAISRAIKLTSPGGAVLWCGPGHLKYREVKGQKLHFDAVEIVRKVLGDD